MSGCEVRAGAIAICFLIDVAYLSFSAERLLTSAGLRYTSSVLRCKHQSNRIYTLHKPIRRCLRFVYNSTSPSTPCLTMDTLTLIFCSCVLFLCWQSNWMWHAILQVMPVHHNNDIFSKGKVQVFPFWYSFFPKLCVEFNSIMLSVRNWVHYVCHLLTLSYLWSQI